MSYQWILDPQDLFHWPANMPSVSSINRRTVIWLGTAEARTICNGRALHLGISMGGCVNAPMLVINGADEPTSPSTTRSSSATARAQRFIWINGRPFRSR